MMSKSKMREGRLHGKPERGVGVTEVSLFSLFSFVFLFSLVACLLKGSTGKVKEEGGPSARKEGNLERKRAVDRG
jgi:hypothetical protein